MNADKLTDILREHRWSYIKHRCHCDKPTSITEWPAHVADVIQKAQVVTLIDNQSIGLDTSDGYHTFRELYHYRMLYNALLVNEWAAQHKFDIHKSWRHSDGELCFDGGWFVVVADLPTGQVTNHYKAEHWDLFDVQTREFATEYDGHTPEVGAQRLERLLRMNTAGKAT